MTGSSKLLYRSFSLYQFYKYFFIRLIALTVLGLMIWLYNNNHVVMTIIAILALIAFLLIGESELKIYSGKIRCAPDTILPVRSWRKIFLINDVRSFDVKGTFNVSVDIDSDLSNFARSSPFSFYKSDPYNYIGIGLKDGSIINVPTHIYIDKLKKAEGIVHQLLVDAAEINERKDTQIS